MVYMPHRSLSTVVYLCVCLQVAYIAYACAKVGYVPSGAEELVQLASSAYRTLIAQGNYHWALKLLHSLTSLELFLDSELSKLFTLETLEDLDRYIAGTAVCCDICID